MRSLRPAVLLALALASGACSHSAPGDPYLYTPPPASAAPAGLDPATWTTHLEDELLPYWRMPAAQGTPPGNFPTWRGMDGAVSGSTNRKPRMLGRQIFAYSAGYLMTGDEALLDLARAGQRWLLDHGRDTARGGWWPDLDQSGTGLDGDKWAQDMAYDAMGPAAFFYVTRDAEAEAAVLATRDLLFDPATYWDDANGRIRDGLDGALAAERWMGSSGSWQLVAQLDPVTAFLLLDQPAFSEAARRDQALADLRRLQGLIKTAFWRDGIFWGSTGDVGRYGSNHTDFGHILKAYWALLQIDKRLPDQPLRGFLAERAPATLRLAWDEPWGRWAKSPGSATTVNYGSDWWAYAEADQLAATLALHDPAWIPVLGQSSAHFRADYVDGTQAARELIPSIRRDGTRVYAWPTSDTAKCNEWKNGFHSTEHALVMYLFSHWLAGTPAPLHFAFPAGQVEALAVAARPYTFLGTVDHYQDQGALARDPSRHHVVIWFKDLR
jgi:mannose/cellobiose epimerase-like protein (N-acyl-D-glucosamine 2-epimerase family)